MRYMLEQQLVGTSSAERAPADQPRTALGAAADSPGPPTSVEWSPVHVSDRCSCLTGAGCMSQGETASRSLFDLMDGHSCPSWCVGQECPTYEVKAIQETAALLADQRRECACGRAQRDAPPPSPHLQRLYDSRTDFSFRCPAQTYPSPSMTSTWKSGLSNTG